MDLQVVTLVVGGVALIWAMTCLPDLGVVIAKKIRAHLPTSERTCGNCGQLFSPRTSTAKSGSPASSADFGPSRCLSSAMGRSRRPNP